MKFEKKVEIAKKRGYELITKEELAKRIGEDLWIACGCLQCGIASGEKDFTEILYVIFPENYDEREAQRLFGVMGGSIKYGIIAKCKYCGHSEVYTDW